MRAFSRQPTALLLLITIATAATAASSKLPNTPCEGDSSQSAHFWWPRVTRTIRGRNALEAAAGIASEFSPAARASARSHSVAHRKLGGPTFAEVLAATAETPGRADPTGEVSATALPIVDPTAPASTVPKPANSASGPIAEANPLARSPTSAAGDAKKTPGKGAEADPPASLPVHVKPSGPVPKRPSSTPTPTGKGPEPKRTASTPKQTAPNPKQPALKPKLPARKPQQNPQTTAADTPLLKPPTLLPKPAATARPLATIQSTGATPLATTKAVNTTTKAVNGTGTATAGNTTTKAVNVTGTATAGNTTTKAVNVTGTATAGNTTTKAVNGTGTATAVNTTTKAVNGTGTAAAGNTTTKAVNGTGTAGNSTGSAGNSTTPPPQHAVGSRDCQYVPLRQLHTCAVGFARTAGIRGGQWPTSSLFEVDSEADSLDFAKLPANSLRYALMTLREGAIITFSRSMEIVLQGNLFLRSRVTIDGRGVHVRITNGSIVLSNVNDVIIHNIEVSGNPRGDLIPIYNSSRVWIDHCRLQDALTGTVDVAKGSTDITISNNYVSSRGQTMQLGVSDTEAADSAMRVTVYRNWFNASGSMQPLCRKGRCHVANNVYTSWSYYCLAARRGALIRSEKNFFRTAAGSPRREVTPWYGGMPATDVWYDATVTIASFQDYLAGGAKFNRTAYAGPTPIFTPPYVLSLPRNPRQMEGVLKINCGPKYDVDAALPPASSEFLPPAPPPPVVVNTTANSTASTTANTTAGGNSTTTPGNSTASPPSSNDCQYSPAGAGIALGNCAMGFAAAGLVGGAAKTTYVVTLEEDSTSGTRQGSLRWGISNFYRTGAYIKFARDMTIQLAGPIYVKSFMTLDGRGVNVKIVGDSLLVQHATQVIIHNIEFASSRTAPATISLYNSSSTWIDHCRFSNLSASIPAIELARNSTAVTISNSHFRGTAANQSAAANATSGSGTGSALHLGQSDSDGINRDMNVTVYRNWFESLSAMQPTCRLGKCDVANNLYTNWTGFAVEARAGAQVLLQSNLFISGSDSVQVVANTTTVPPGLVAEAANSTNSVRSATGAAAAAAAGAGAVAASANSSIPLGPTVNSSLVFSPPYVLPLGNPSTILFAPFIKLNVGPHAN